MKLTEILKSKNISDSSIKLYEANLKRLNDNKPITNLKFLKSPEVILEKIKDKSKSTIRSYIIAILSLLKELPKTEKLYKSYYEYLIQYNKELAINNGKSEKQKENWIEQSEVLNIFNELSQTIQILLKKKKINVIEYNEILKWIILSLYTLQPPRRNLDYLKLKVIKNYKDDMDKEFNYLDLTNKKFIFNNFKTASTYKSQIIDISPELYSNILLFLKIHPNKTELKTDNVYFLVDHDGKHLDKNGITKNLYKIFKKKVGASMLRNIYLTDKYSDKLKELKTDASLMGTSSSTIENQYVKQADA